MKWVRSAVRFLLVPGLIALALPALAQDSATSQPTSHQERLDVQRPLLPDAAAKEVEELEAKIEELERSGLTAETREQQDAALDEAVALAGRVLEIRTGLQGNTADIVRWRDAEGNPATWYELRTAVLRVEHFHLLKGLDGDARTELASLVGTGEEFERLYKEGKYVEAQELSERQVEIRSRVMGDDHPYTLGWINDLGVLLLDQGRLAEAGPCLRESLQGKRLALGHDHPDTLTSINNLGNLLLDQGLLAEAEPCLREALEGSRRVLGDRHADTLVSAINLGNLLEEQGRLAEAEPYFREAMEGLRRVRGDEHRNTLVSINNLGLLLDSMGRVAEAEPYLREALEGFRRVRGVEHPDTLASLNNLGALLLEHGRLAEAEPYLREALEGLRHVPIAMESSKLTSTTNLGMLLLYQGRLAEAEPYLGEALEGRRLVLGDEHADTLNSINSLGMLLEDQGRPTEAEPYYREAVEGCRRVLGDEHPDTLVSINNMGRLLLRQGRLAEAEPYFREALSVAEGLRMGVTGGTQERALFAGALELPAIAAGYARTLAALGRASEALSVLERGRSRAGLDLMAGGSAEAERLLRGSGDAEVLARYDATLDEEQSAKLAVFEAEARMAKAPEKEKAEWRERIKAARVTLSEKTASVFQELRGLVPAGEPASSEVVLGSLEGGEALLSYSWTDDGAIALVAHAGEVRAVTLVKDKNETAKLADALKALRGRIAFRPSAGDEVPAAVLAAAREAAVPEELRKLLEGVTVLTVIADGPLAGVPLETLLPEVPVVYAPSATIAMRCRQAAAERATRTASAVVLGDPVFAIGEYEEQDYPEIGVLLEVVPEGSIAARAGLQRGDVLLGYGEHVLFSEQDLAAAISATPTERSRGQEQAMVWRAGEELEVALAPGPMGIVLAKTSPAEGLRTMAVLDRAAASTGAGATALEQVRLYGEALESLPATRVEAEAVAALLGDDTTLLLGKDASVPRLRQAIESRRPRVLHLATHGLMGSADRPLLASLALSTPPEPSPEDIGFLTLEEILGTWGAQLRESELVTLSACDTGRGVRQGDTVMALPLGLFVAGAETVVASLWKVDDRATALLMARFYANWLGRTTSAREIDGVRYAAGKPMPKLASLREAQQWLRSLTSADRDRLSASDAGQIVEAARAAAGGEPLAEEAAAGLHPYEHPFYWAGFVLYGSPW